MRFGSRLLRTSLLCLLSVVCAGLARAQRAELVAADDRGITLRVQVPEWTLTPNGGGRSMLVARGLEVSAIPGRPLLPFAAALIAIPPGGRVVARVTEASTEELREGVNLAIALKPGMRDDGGALGVVPTMEGVPPIADGPWPGSTVELGEPFTVHRQRVVAVRLYPFRYDEATSRLWARRALTVRIEFQGGPSAPPGTPPEPDGHFEPVLKGTILNYEQGRRWRIRRAVPEGTLFPAPRSAPGPPPRAAASCGGSGAGRGARGPRWRGGSGAIPRWCSCPACAGGTACACRPSRGADRASTFRRGRPTRGASTGSRTTSTGRRLPTPTRTSSSGPSRSSSTPFPTRSSSRSTISMPRRPRISSSS